MEERSIPYFAHEGDMTRMEQSNKRLFAIVVILIIALILTNEAWFYYENRFKEVVTTAEAEQEIEDGSDYTTGGNFNAETEDQNNNQEEKP
jgi:hypothetical protein